MAKGNVLHVDANGICHLDRECEEFAGRAVGSIPVDSEEARRRIHCADCD